MRLSLPTSDAQLTGRWHYERGRQLYEAGRYRKAAAAFRKAIRRAPGMPIVHVSRGLSLIRLNRHQQAVRSIERALTLIAESGRFDDTSWLAQAAYEGARAYEQLGQPYMALRLYTKAIDAAPQDIAPETIVEVLRQRGRTHLHLQLYARALEDLTQAINIDPSKAGAYFDRAAAYEGLAQNAQAIEDLRAFLASADPQDPRLEEARAHLADLTKGFEAP